MFRFAVATLALLAAQSAGAAVSPFYDSAEKIMAILQSAEVADALRQAPIGAISNTGTYPDGADEWTVRVQDCDLKLRLIATPPAGVGKTTYKVEVPGICQ